MNFNKILAYGNAARKGLPISRSAWKSPTDIRRMQNEAIHKAVSIAYYHTEFYRKKYDAAGVHPDDIRSLEDLPKLPITTKQELIDNFDAAIPAPMNRDLSFLMGTSGTTGQAIQIYKDQIWLAHAFGFTLRMRRLHDMGIPKAAFIYDANAENNIETQMEIFLKYFSRHALQISVETEVGEIMTMLENSKVNYIATYPSMMRELARLRRDGRGQNLRIKKVGVSGELLDDFSRRYIEEAFDCECYNAYISTEGGPVALECPHKKMHLNSDFVNVEIVDQQGRPRPVGEDGLILVTCYDTGYGTPIIRYNGCADIGQISDETCSCGQNTPIMGPIKGRSVESIRLPDGRVYHAFSMTIPMEKIQLEFGKGRLRTYQIWQSDPATVSISLIRNEAKTAPDDDLADLLTVVREKYGKQLGSDITLTVKEVKYEDLQKVDNIGMPTPLVLGMR